MASTSIFTLTAIATGAIQSDDVLAIVDVHDSAQAAQGSTRKTTLAALYRTETTAVTVSTPLPDIAQTWNAAGVTFTAIKLNVTNTASAAASRLLALQVGGTDKFSLRKDGLLTIAGGLTLDGNVVFTSDATYDIGASGASRPRDGLFSRNVIVNATFSSLVNAAGTPALAAASGTTFSQYIQLTNTGGTTLLGIESSVGNVLLGGTAAYATVFGTSAARSLQLVTNNAVQLSIASTGVATFSAQLVVTTGGLTVSAGTTAVQALTATTGVFSSTVSMTALTATTGAFSSTVSMTALTATTGTFSGLVTVPGGAKFLKTSTNLTDGAAAGAGTLTNAPASTNPTKWIPIDDNGTIRYLPAW